MRRREFITLLGGAAAAWPLAARAQQPLPVIGFLSSLSELQTAHLVMALVRGLSEAGLVAGQSITIDYHFAEGQYDRLPAFADEFVRQRVSLIVAAGPPAALAAKAATTTIPIVFIVGFDPVAETAWSRASVGQAATRLAFFSSRRWLGKSASRFCVSLIPRRPPWRCW